MNDDQTKVILFAILECLKKQEVAKEDNRENQKLNRRRDSFAQICSMYAVIAIFIATLSLGFLTYNRPEGTPSKVTDSIVTFSLLLSVLLSISSSVALGVGASPTLLLSLPTKDAFQDLLFLLVVSGLPRSLAYKLQLYQCLPCPAASRSDDPARLHRHGPWGKVRANIALRAISFWSMGKTKKLPSTESQFILGMLLVALVCIVLSLLSLAVAVVTFAWAELGGRVAILATVSLVCPFAVIGCVAVIYRCTLSAWVHEKKYLEHEQFGLSVDELHHPI